MNAPKRTPSRHAPPPRARTGAIPPTRASTCVSPDRRRRAPARSTCTPTASARQIPALPDRRQHKVNRTYKKHIRAIPSDLFAAERVHLRPLPAYVPEVYRLHHRVVDVYGYVNLHTNRYSVPADWVARTVPARRAPVMPNG